VRKLLDTEYCIRTYGDPVLRDMCVEIGRVDAAIRTALERMARTMYRSGGVGLAAPQVGLTTQLVVVDAEGELLQLVNPRVIERSGQNVLEEGCLSLPGVSIRVPRSQWVRISALNAAGVPVEVEGEDLLAHVLQHELDHLAGVLIIDYASTLERSYVERQLAQTAMEAR